MRLNTISSSFTKRYIVAISLIAILSSGAFYILNLALKTGDTTALVINISGKQRMLSQRIASLSQYHQRTINSQSDAKHLKVISFELQKALTEMHKANIALSSGKMSEEIQVPLSQEIANFYFGDINLKNRVEEYIAKTKLLLTLQDNSKREQLLDEIVMTSRMLLPDLHAAVLQYQKEGEENINNIRNLETLALVLTLFTLMLEIILIFQPMANKIGELFSKLEHNKENLEYQVKLRTISLEQAKATMGF